MPSEVILFESKDGVKKYPLSSSSVKLDFANEVDLSEVTEDFTVPADGIVITDTGEATVNKGNIIRNSSSSFCHFIPYRHTTSLPKETTADDIKYADEESSANSPVKNANFISVKDVLDDVVPALAEMEGTVSTLSGKVNTAEGNISTLQSGLSTATSNISTLSGKMTTAEGNISTLQTKMTSVEGNISTLSGKVNTAESDISTLQSGLSTTNTNVSTLQTKMTSAETNISTLQTKMASAESNISTLQSGLSAANTNVNKKFTINKFTFAPAAWHSSSASADYPYEASVSTSKYSDTFEPTHVEIVPANDTPFFTTAEQEAMLNINANLAITANRVTIYAKQAITCNIKVKICGEI